MDISSDLTALGRTPIAVISAGVKSILDIPKTLEYLVYKSLVNALLVNIYGLSFHRSSSLIMQETQEVYVAAYKSDEFPAFFTEKSGCKVQKLSISTELNHLVPT